MLHEIDLSVGGQIWAGWTEANIELTYDACASTFDLGLSRKSPFKDRVLALANGTFVAVRIDGQTVIEGPIDGRRPGFERGSRRLSVGGRSRSGQLQDVSPESKPGQWSKQTIDQIARAIAAPFGVGVVLRGDAGAAFDRVRIKEGEKAADAIRRLARQRGLILSNNGRDLVLTNAKAAGPFIGVLEEGVNLESLDADESITDRFSIITVKGHKPGGMVFDTDGVIGSTAIARDEAVGLYRPLVIVASAGGSSADLQKQANWESATRMGKSRSATAKVAGFTLAGRLYQPGQLVQVISETCDLDETRLISRAAFRVSKAEGCTTSLTLMPPQAFLPEPPEPPKAKTSGQSGGYQWDPSLLSSG